MDSEQTEPRKLLIVTGVGVIIAAAVWWFGFYDQALPPQTQPTPTPAAPIVLSPDLKTFSGKITEKTASAITVEWVVYEKNDLKDSKTHLKKVFWDNSTVFVLSRLGPTSVIPRKAKSSDLKVGQTVVVTTTTPVQSSNELTASEIRIIIPPTPTPAKTR